MHHLCWPTFSVLLSFSTAGFVCLFILKCHSEETEKLVISRGRAGERFVRFIVEFVGRIAATQRSPKQWIQQKIMPLGPLSKDEPTSLRDICKGI